MSNEVITAAKISGDFFGDGEISELEKLMEGKTLSTFAITDDTISKYIYGITAEEFLTLLTDN